MRVFVTGATGFIGSALVAELVEAGHEVTGLVRTHGRADQLSQMNAKPVIGSLDDLALLERCARESDGVVHLAYMHELTQASFGKRLRIFLGGSPAQIPLRYARTGFAMDAAAITALGNGLSGSNSPFLAISGLMGMPKGRVVTEQDAIDPTSVGGPRSVNERLVLAFAQQGVRSMVARFPLFVHGEGDKGGFLPTAIRAAVKNKVSGYEGDGLNRLPALHRPDAAHLLRLALEKGTAGSVYHGVAEEGIPLKEIAAQIALKVGVPAASLSPKQARKQFSYFAMFFSQDNPASAALTKKELGWNPTGPTLAEDIGNFSLEG